MTHGIGVLVVFIFLVVSILFCLIKCQNDLENFL